MTQATDALSGHEAGSALDAPGRRSARRLAKSLLALTKPRIIVELLVTTVPTMLLARRGFPAIELIVITLVGGTLAAGETSTEAWQ